MLPQERVSGCCIEVPGSRQLSITALEPCKLGSQPHTGAVQLHLAQVKSVQHQGVSCTGVQLEIADQILMASKITIAGGCVQTGFQFKAALTAS